MAKKKQDSRGIRLRKTKNFTKFENLVNYHTELKFVDLRVSI